MVLYVKHKNLSKHVNSMTPSCTLWILEERGAGHTFFNVYYVKLQYSVVFRWHVRWNKLSKHVNSMTPSCTLRRILEERGAGHTFFNGFRPTRRALIKIWRVCVCVIEIHIMVHVCVCVHYCTYIRKWFLLPCVWQKRRLWLWSHSYSKTRESWFV
jgi:hypothetical protein